LSIFDIFKNKKKITESDVSKSIDEYFEKLDQFKQLKKSELRSIPNTDLEML